MQNGLSEPIFIVLRKIIFVMKKSAVILISLGTPEAPTPKGISTFLKLFLSDCRVVEAPKIVWWFILRCIVIPLRAKKVAKAYKEIWWDGCYKKIDVKCDEECRALCKGSPIRVITSRQVLALQEKLNTDLDADSPLVVSAVTYGQPSIESVINDLKIKGIEHFIALPMYPQYSGSTTGAIYDQISNIIHGARNVPDITTIKSYSNDSGYIHSLAESVKNHWEKYGRKEKLLMSFHGIPQEYADKGDPYEKHCISTANALSEELGLTNSDWSMGFQSRFGPKKWLQPYIDNQLIDCIKEGVKSVDIISPAFTADCLETLEELNIGYRELFLEAGGKDYSYIACVNDSPLFISALADIVKKRLN